VLEPLGGMRRNGLDHVEWEAFSMTNSCLLTLTIISLAEETPWGEYMHALTSPRPVSIESVLEHLSKEAF
jgi:hypothetical protein